MARSKGRSDLISGAFALLVIVSLIAVVMYLQAVGPADKGLQYSIMFTDVGGLSGNAPVVVAGQRVGKVVGINTRPVVTEGSRQVEVEVRIIINEEYQDVVVIPADTVAQVQMGSFFGGNRLVLKLGNSSELVRPGAQLPVPGRPPVELNDIIESANATMKELHVGLKKLAAMLDKDEFTENIEASLASMRSALDRLDKGLEDMEPAFKKVGPTFDAANALVEELRLLLDANADAISATLQHLESASGKLDKLLAEGQGVPQLVDSLNNIANNLDSVLNNINDLVLDNQLNIQVSLENVRHATDSLRMFARRIEADPSLLIWGGKEEAVPGLERGGPALDVDEQAIRNSGRRPRKESD